MTAATILAHRAALLRRLCAAIRACTARHITAAELDEVIMECRDAARGVACSE